MPDPLPDPREAAHHARVDALLAEHLERRRRGIAHPVHDFLFSYYSFRPAQLRRWHPGGGTPEEVEAKRTLIEQTRALLAATAGRPASLGCFGLHEWAMVYRQTATDTRHPWPLRLGHSGTDEVVESHRIACTHFDAFRFFTDDARPLNTLSPTSQDRPAFEQPGCLHAGMDLYKHSARLLPLICSDLVMDAFELAWDIRVLDMRAAPYDFSGLRMDRTAAEWSAVEIETTEGKREYAEAQQRFAERAAPIRGDLISACERLLAISDQSRTENERRDDT